MTELTSIIGEIEKGRQGVAAFGFYNGPVGIRDRGDWLEVAFFSPPVRATLPVTRMLDGKSVRITGIETRDPDPATPVRPRSANTRVIVATVVPVI